MHSSLGIKRCTRFWMQIRIPILHSYFMHNIFTLCFKQLQHLHFLWHQVMLWILFSSFSCHISYLYLWNYLCSSWVSNWRREMICCQLTPTLYHCATEDYGHVLLFVYLYLNLPWIFQILNITVCNLIILCITWVRTSYIL